MTISNSVPFGVEAKIDINGLPYGTISGDYRIMREKADITDTESVVATQCRLSPLRKIVLNFTAHRDNDKAYHISPQNVTDPLGISIQIWPNGRADIAGSIDIPILKIPDVGGNWSVQGGAVQTINCSNGENDGPFFLPGE